jgi:cobalt-zinc-cadmium resistance protein CzcA
MEEALEADTSGNAYSFTQPIELRVQELIAGVRSDIGISLYGDDLDTLAAKADQIASKRIVVVVVAPEQQAVPGGRRSSAG